MKYRSSDRRSSASRPKQLMSKVSPGPVICTPTYRSVPAVRSLILALWPRWNSLAMRNDRPPSRYECVARQANRKIRPRTKPVQTRYTIPASGPYHQHSRAAGPLSLVARGGQMGQPVGGDHPFEVAAGTLGTRIGLEELPEAGSVAGDEQVR